MKPFSFVHAADLHLDSPFKGISEVNEEIGSELAEATFRAFNRLIDLCIEKRVDFLLIAGDVYDGADRSLRAQLRFLDDLERLSKAGIGAYIVHGNHDPLDGWSANLNWPPKVHIFHGKSVQEVLVERDGEAIARICGISFHTRKITTNLARKFSKVPTSKEDPFTIGLLHCNVGTETGHEPYAPCTLKDLTNLDFDYWALGHIHKRSVLNDSPPVIYPGSPQGLNPKEDGERGCYFVEVDGKGRPTPQFIEVDSMRWFVEELPIDAMDTEQDLVSKISDLLEDIRQRANGRPSIFRLILTGRSAIHASISRKGFTEDLLANMRENEEGEERIVWVESIEDNTHSEIDTDSLLEREDFVGDLVRLFDEMLKSKKKSAEIKEHLEPLFSSPRGRKLLDPVDDEHVAELLGRAETLCLDRLTEE